MNENAIQSKLNFNTVHRRTRITKQNYLKIITSIGGSVFGFFKSKRETHVRCKKQCLYNKNIGKRCTMLIQRKLKR